MKKINKIIALSLILALSISVIPVNCYANTHNHDDDFNLIMNKLENVPALTDEEVEKGIEQALKNKLESISDPDERKAMEDGIRANLEYLEYSDCVVPDEAQTYGLDSWWRGWAPDIHIKNKYVAGTIEVIINGVLIATGAGAISVALKKYGKRQLSFMFFKTIKRRVIGKAAIFLGISIPTLVNYIMYVVDPAGQIANYLDSLDSRPNNGYFDVIW